MVNFYIFNAKIRSVDVYFRYKCNITFRSGHEKACFSSVEQTDFNNFDGEESAGILMELF